MRCQCSRAPGWLTRMPMIEIRFARGCYKLEEVTMRRVLIRHTDGPRWSREVSDGELLGSSPRGCELDCREEGRHGVHSCPEAYSDCYLGSPRDPHTSLNPTPPSGPRTAVLLPAFEIKPSCETNGAENARAQRVRRIAIQGVIASCAGSS